MPPFRAPKDLLRYACVLAARAALRATSADYEPASGPALVIAPHPDDETLGCGGLIAAKSAARQRVEVVFLTDGAGSHPGHPIVAPAELVWRRRSEALEALAVLKVDAANVHFIDLPDGSLDRLPRDAASRTVSSIADLIRAVRPAEVLAPFREGGSTEHRAAFDLSAAAHSQAGCGVLLEYPVWAWWNPFRLSSRVGKRAGNLRLELGPLREIKLRALACHRSQVEPLPPWPAPALPRILGWACSGSAEYFFVRKPARASATS